MTAPSPLQVRHTSTIRLSPAERAAVVGLCEAAYEEPIAGYLDTLGPGEHLLGHADGALVAHLMWVTRWLQAGDGPLFRTAYIELVATAPAARRRGHATRLLEEALPRLGGYDLAALSPATEGIYLRLGWRSWRGPLSHRREGRRIADRADERVMILALPRTPPLDLDAPLSVEWRPGEVW